MIGYSVVYCLKCSKKHGATTPIDEWGNWCPTGHSEPFDLICDDCGIAIAYCIENFPIP